MTIANNAATAATASVAPQSNSKSPAATKQNGSAGNGGGDQAISRARLVRAADRERDRSEREQLVVWRKPLQTLKYCGCEVSLLLQTYWQK